MRRMLLLVAPVAAITTTALVVHAATGQATQQVNRQSLAWTTSQVTTTSTSWTNVPGLSVETSCPLQPVASAILSVETGQGSAPAQFRVVRHAITIVNDKQHPLQPGAIDVQTPADAPGLATFTFAKKRLVDGHGEDYLVQWRTPSEQQAQLLKATLKVDWAAAGGTCR